MKLIVFDVDGTISDSQAHICHAMALGFETVGLPAPSRVATLSIVGLSLPVAIARLAPDQDAATQAAIVEGYKASYFTSRAASPAPLYPGAAELLRKLAQRDDLFLGVATGKSRRGLDALLRHHGLEGIFVTRQVADDHPSKPSPEMLFAALADTGIDARDVVMIGDTTFDIEMGRAAGCGTIGVSWGYHPVADLLAAGADRLVDTFAALEAVLGDFVEMHA
ncbi:HAD-IA family hydrolase [Sinirhodobacter sp. WL0062]|uniref:HAD-IA family hydrolase n=1 Tax=Rhodobacter flavimaris TaxID=2907145 RepID=A0ABS8YXF6_9RHOB|nr:HAD-IA family hydrolase [Sinirhodobacter sp. WL0062]MCE5974484.1 HAD-IA family hydrolase [Sinirhodobacter sp. WL0062]